MIWKMLHKWFFFLSEMLFVLFVSALGTALVFCAIDIYNKHEMRQQYAQLVAEWSQSKSYKVMHYENGRSSATTDYYTDAYELLNENVIKFVDQHGNEILIHGHFKVVKLH